MFADNSLWEGLSYTCQLSETVKWSGVIKFLTPINLIEPFFIVGKQLSSTNNKKIIFLSKTYIKIVRINVTKIVLSHFYKIK